MVITGGLRVSFLLSFCNRVLAGGRRSFLVCCCSRSLSLSRVTRGRNVAHRNIHSTVGETRGRLFSVRGELNLTGHFGLVHHKLSRVVRDTRTVGRCGLGRDLSQRVGSDISGVGSATSCLLGL